MRVFVAMDVPEEVKGAIREFVGRLEAECKDARGARWARVEGMHVTLKFIGEVSEEKVEQIKKELASVRLTAESQNQRQGGADAPHSKALRAGETTEAVEGVVEMNFRGVGFFPNAKHPRVFWAGIEASANLSEIAAEIEKRLEGLGIPREERAFRPHLTLARFKSEEGLPKLREAIEKAGAMEFGATQSGEFHLYESKLLRGGAVYTKLGSFPFVER